MFKDLGIKVTLHMRVLGCRLGEQKVRTGILGMLCQICIKGIGGNDVGTLNSKLCSRIESGHTKIWPLTKAKTVSLFGWVTRINSEGCLAKQVM